MSLGPLPDLWHSRDFPVLVEIYRRHTAGQRPVETQHVATALDLDHDQVLDACVALTPIYLDGRAHRSAGGVIYLFQIRGLTDRGRRKVGLWPDEDADADALVQLLEQAAAQADDEHDAGALKRAGRLLRGVPSAVIADVTAALIRQQTGL